MHLDFTRSQCALAATWRPAVTSDKAPVRYEWSVGVAGESVGGLLLAVVEGDGQQQHGLVHDQELTEVW